MRNYKMITQPAKGNGIIQGCALRKFKGSPVVLTCETLGAKPVICVKNLRFSSHREQRLGAKGPPGHRVLLEHSPVSCSMKFFQLIRYGIV